jgi:hypothetical protein
MAGLEVYEFGEFTLGARERRLGRGIRAITLEPKSYDVLLALVRRAGQLASKRELLKLVWPESFMEEGIHAVHISSAAKYLAMPRAPGASSRPFHDRATVLPAAVRRRNWNRQKSAVPQGRPRPAMAIAEAGWSKKS